MKGILRYQVVKEIEVDFNEDTFATTENIHTFWNKLAEKEGNVTRLTKGPQKGEYNIKGIKLTDENGKTIFK